MDNLVLDWAYAQLMNSTCESLLLRKNELKYMCIYMCLNCFVVVVFMVYSQKFGVYLYILQFIELILNSF